MKLPLLHANRLQQTVWSGIALVLLLATSLFAGCHSAPRPVAAVRPAPPSIDIGMVRPGDTLGVRFSFSDKETFELVKIVKEMGTITLLSNEVFTVTNKFPEQIETEIHDRYASKYSEQLSARVLFTSHRWYLIEGAVRSPGRKPYDDPLSLFDAIQAAGGTTSEADRAKISIAYMEGGAPPAVIDLTKRESKDGREFYLQAGAKIIVPRSRYAKSSNKALVSPSLKE